MSVLYGRKVTVTAGVPGDTGLEVTGLRTVFKIEKTLEKTPNNSIIEIYNLSDESRSAVEQSGAVVRVTAGYGDSAKDIFSGDIATVVTKRAGPDIITSIEAGDTLLAYQTKETDASFVPGTKSGTVLDHLVGAFGLIKGEVSGFNFDDEYLNGVSFSGKIHNHLDALIGKQMGLNWSIQDGQLQILPKLSASSLPAVLLTPDTGLVGSPFKRIVLSQDIARKVSGRDAENGAQVKSLLNPEITPGRLIHVESRFVAGVFKVVKVIHSGDTHSVSYYSDVEAVSV